MLHLTGERKYPHGCQPRLISIAMMGSFTATHRFQGKQLLVKMSDKKSDTSSHVHLELKAIVIIIFITY